MPTVAIVGAGLIGRAWAVVFARAGWTVEMTDSDPAQLSLAVARIRAALTEHPLDGFDGAASGAERVSVSPSLEETVADAALVQECGPEDVSIKRALFAALDKHAAPDAVLASSTSAIVASRFTEDLPGRARCLVAHPINPPHLVPLVELCGAPWTDASVIEKAKAIYKSVGQIPIVVRKEVAGFVLNRLQVALLAEALRLVGSGVVSARDLDETLANGLGLRWSFLGPFSTIELNAPGGIPDYFARYGEAFRSLADDAPPVDPWAKDNLARVLENWGETPPAPEIAARSQRRDRKLAALRNHKRAQAEAAPKT